MKYEGLFFLSVRICFLKDEDFFFKDEDLFFRSMRICFLNNEDLFF